MKAHLSVFALSAILIASIGMAPAFGQISVEVTTDKESYTDGETIQITGKVAQLLGGYDITLSVSTSNGNVVAIDQFPVGADKKFSTNVTAGGGLMKVGETYVVKVQYGDRLNNSGTTSFEFSGSTVSPPSKGGDGSVVTDTTVSISGSNDLIGYEITGGKLLGIVPNVDDKSLIVSIEAIKNGTLTLIIPKSVFDAIKDDGSDDDSIILVDGAETKNYEETITSTDRTLTIEFPAGTEEIEIIGTFVIPEFGTIAAMILAVAIISIIAISAKSKLSIVPRY